MVLKLKEYSVTFGVNDGEYSTSIYFNTNYKVKQINNSCFKIGDLEIMTHEPIEEIQVLISDEWKNI